MRIKTRLHQSRRDFDAIYECEHCGFEKEDRGYDDAYFHSTVIPSMTCSECGKTGNGPSSSPIVPEGVVL